MSYQVKFADCDGSISYSPLFPTWDGAYSYKMQLVRSGEASVSASWIIEV